MSDYNVTIIPVGKTAGPELEAALPRVSKLLRQPVELRGALPVPQGIEDTDRRQFRTSLLLDRLRSMVPQLGAGTLWGPGGALPDKPSLRTHALVFVTDVDLFTADRDGVFAALVPAKSLAVVSVRRLREAFYRRKADPVKQRARMVKELARMALRLRPHGQCSDPTCVMAASRMLMDVDLKEEKLCRACSDRLFEGRVQI